MNTSRANPKHVNAALREHAANQHQGDTQPKMPVKTPVKTPDKILRLLAAKPSMTLSEVAAEIQKSLSAVERASSKLVKEGRMKYVGPQKGGHWEVLEEYDE